MLLQKRLSASTAYKVVFNISLPTPFGLWYKKVGPAMFVMSQPRF